jgi:putative ABC transport system permease protein
MFQNYFKSAIRQLWKNKFYSSINILGLAIGLSGCLFMVLYVVDEVSYDQFHKNKDHIYRITESFKSGEGIETTALTPYKFATELKHQFPEIEKAVRTDYDITSFTVHYADKKFQEKSITCADSSFFNFFSFRLLQGNPNTVLTDPYTVAISDEQARKYFGAGEAMGKVLTFTDPHSYKSFEAKVTGVFKAMPGNSHFHKDLILSMATADILIPERKEELGWTSVFTYFQLAPGTDANVFEKKINDYLFKTYSQEKKWWVKFSLQSLNDIHLRSHLKEEQEPNGDMAYVYIFSAIAIALILLAAVNYMNLATARAANRAREVGVRKVVGALKRQLIYQFLVESIIITLISLILAGCLVTLLLPFVNNLSGKNLTIDFLNPALLAGILIVTLIIGICSGSYPSFFLSAFKPVTVLKGALANTGRRTLLLRRGLVVFQFSISIILIIGTIVIYDQWKYLQTKKLGINSSHTVIVRTHSDKLQKQYPVLKNELLQQPGVMAVTACNKDFSQRFGNYTTVRTNELPDGKIMPWSDVDVNFFKTFDIPLIHGVDFSATDATDSVSRFILNQSGVRQLGLTEESAVGKMIKAFGHKGQIIGVVKDFHFESLHTPISAAIFSPTSSGMGWMAVKIKSDAIDKTLQLIQKEYHRVDAAATFDYAFLDDKITALYTSEARFFQVFISFSTLAIIIACLGIFGLATFSASQRTKEIGIRKVLGASVQNISVLLSKEFIRLVILANIIAWPVAYVGMQQWLQDFPYRIAINGWMFILAASITLCIAIVTVSWQAIKAALANPVKSLRTE